MNLEQEICEAISIIAERAVDKAQYDKTVKAKIVSIADQTIGKYKVRYQDSTFFAYSNASDINYSVGSLVYILIPGNDMSRDKVILGTVDKLGANYGVNPDRDDAYDIVGKNIVTSADSYGLQSYKGGGMEIILYDKDNPRSVLKIDTAGAYNYLRQSGWIICGATFKTELPQEQQYRGNYGICFTLDFDDSNGNKVISRKYIVDVDDMTGTPYQFTTPSRQYGIFEIDSLKFREIRQISIFCKDFPNSKDTGLVDDIFVYNIELTGANQLTQNELDGISLSINTPNGLFFGNGTTLAELPLVADLKIKGRSIDNSSQKVNYYWASENVLIGTNSEYYSKYTGQGWKCLNEKNLIREATRTTAPVIEWIPSDHNFSIPKSSVLARETVFKCTAVYGSVIVEAQITITNYDSQYDIKINSDKGIQFYYDIGTPTLTCVVNGSEALASNFKFVWATEDDSGGFTILEETTQYNNEYNNAVSEMNKLLGQIERQEKLQAANQSLLDYYQSIIDRYDKIVVDGDDTAYPLTRVEHEKVIHIDVGEIDKTKRWKCSVLSLADEFLGTGSIVLYNTQDAEGLYNLVINNGTQIFNYTGGGVSPVNESLENIQEIPPLSFTIYDNLGNSLGEEIIKNCTCQWIVPISRTLLKIPDEYKTTSVDQTAGTATYSDYKTFKYEIDDKYNLFKSRNDIQLNVQYQGLNLVAVTSFTFTKDGEIGTNGAEFTAKIIPYTDGTSDGYPCIINNGQLNFTPKSANQWFSLQFWHNGVEIYNSFVSGTTTERKPIVLSWKILTNVYTASVKDNTLITVSNGGFSATQPSPNNTYANVIRCAVTYEGIVYYAEYPVVSIYQASGYTIRLKESSGFHYVKYSHDGRLPEYDNTEPFTIEVKKNINGYTEDVSTLTNPDYSITYNWKLEGRLYSKDGKSWVSHNDLAFIDDPTIGKNQKYVKPKEEYDGYCLTNAVTCELTFKNSRVGYIYIPIHMYLDKTGLSALDIWDGNSILVDDNGGIVLAPQLGAGRKESDNTFTGVLMGIAKESNKTVDEIGLLGFNHAQRTFFIDSEDGSAIFGRDGTGQIILDPTSQKSLLYSNSFWKNYNAKGKPSSYSSSNENGQGLLIDLTTPEIRYGNGNFKLDSAGNLKSRGYVQLGKENNGQIVLDPNSNKALIYSHNFWKSYNSDGAPSNYTSSNEAGRGLLIDLTTPEIRWGNGNFTVNSEGDISARGHVLLGKGENGQIVLDPTLNKAYIYSHNFWRSYKADGTPSSYSSSNESGQGLLIDLTTPEIRYGNGNFKLDKNGNATLKGDGRIAGWVITDTEIHNDKNTTYSIAEGITGLASPPYYSVPGAKVVNLSYYSNYGTPPPSVQNTDVAAFWAGGNLSSNLLNYNGCFITHSGVIKARTILFEGASRKPIFFGPNLYQTESAVYSQYKNEITSGLEGFYLGTDGLRIGSDNRCLIRSDGLGYFAGFQMYANGLETKGEKGYIALDSKKGIIFGGTGAFSNRFALGEGDTSWFHSIGSINGVTVWTIDKNGKTKIRDITGGPPEGGTWRVDEEGNGYFYTAQGGSNVGAGLGWKLDRNGVGAFNSIESIVNEDNWKISTDGHAILKAVTPGKDINNELAWYISVDGDAGFKSINQISSVKSGVAWSISDSGSMDIDSIHGTNQAAWEITTNGSLSMAGDRFHIGTEGKVHMNPKGYSESESGNVITLRQDGSFDAASGKFKVGPQGYITALEGLKTQLIVEDKAIIIKEGSTEKFHVGSGGKITTVQGIESSGKINCPNLEATGRIVCTTMKAATYEGLPSSRSISAYNTPYSFVLTHDEEGNVNGVSALTYYLDR